METTTDTSPSYRKRAPTLKVAEFDPRLKQYFFWPGVVLCVITVVGIAVLPFWVIFGRRYIDRYFEHLHAELTTRAMHFQKGIWFQTSRTIPLDKIQDLTFKEGPVLRYFGLSTLKIETAGQSSEAAADLSLTGIVEAHRFRQDVLDQRDEVTGFHPAPSSDGQADQESVVDLLTEIRDSLQNIESRLQER